MCGDGDEAYKNSDDHKYDDDNNNNNNNNKEAKRSGKEVKIQESVYRDATNVEPYDCTSNNWSHWNSNKKLKEKFGNHTRKTFDRFTKKTAILGTSHIIRKVLQCEA